MRRSHFPPAVALGLGAVLLVSGLTGCARPQARYEVAPLARPDGGRRSLVMASPAARQSVMPARRPPWYAFRNDRPRAITLGVAGPTVQTSHTRTIDRLGSFNGEVIDHFRRRTYRTEHRSTSY